jgi:hypothetical protein
MWHVVGPQHSLTRMMCGSATISTLPAPALACWPVQAPVQAASPIAHELQQVMTCCVSVSKRLDCRAFYVGKVFYVHVQPTNLYNAALCRYADADRSTCLWSRWEDKLHASRSAA